MTTELNFTDNELLEQFENCTLPIDLLTHENLLRISWVLLNSYKLELATHKNCTLKERYYREVIKNNKFNLSLTKAYTEILYYFMKKSSAKTFDKLMSEFPRLKYNFKELVRTHYGYDILKEHRNQESKPIDTILFTF
ncbi:hypothetical protein [Lutibacter sp.]|uniref:hypothetical protein n=1 Tax=Lutibacter sp. TaxID=1925666 RepID=UPI0027371E76|nr:hypothetical protein [Lutibacter sp.]MDP3312371.1 hypothetical protein [Lutibacter sp.]